MEKSNLFLLFSLYYKEKHSILNPSTRKRRDRKWVSGFVHPVKCAVDVETFSFSGHYNSISATIHLISFSVLFQQIYLNGAQKEMNEWRCVKANSSKLTNVSFSLHPMSNKHTVKKADVPMCKSKVNTFHN